MLDECGAEHSGWLSPTLKATARHVVCELGMLVQFFTTDGTEYTEGLGLGAWVVEGPSLRMKLWRACMSVPSP